MNVDELIAQRDTVPDMGDDPETDRLQAWLVNAGQEAADRGDPAFFPQRLFRFGAREHWQDHLQLGTSEEDDLDPAVLKYGWQFPLTTMQEHRDKWPSIRQHDVLLPLVGDMPLVGSNITAVCIRDGVVYARAWVNVSSLLRSYQLADGVQKERVCSTWWYQASVANMAHVWDAHLPESVKAVPTDLDPEDMELAKPQGGKKVRVWLLSPTQMAKTGPLSRKDDSLPLDTLWEKRDKPEEWLTNALIFDLRESLKKWAKEAPGTVTKHQADLKRRGLPVELPKTVDSYQSGCSKSESSESDVQSRRTKAHHPKKPKAAEMHKPREAKSKRQVPAAPAPRLPAKVKEAAEELLRMQRMHPPSKEPEYSPTLPRGSPGTSLPIYSEGEAGGSKGSGSRKRSRSPSPATEVHARGGTAQAAAPAGPGGGETQTPSSIVPQAAPAAGGSAPRKETVHQRLARLKAEAAQAEAEIAESAALEENAVLRKRVLELEEQATLNARALKEAKAHVDKLEGKVTELRKQREFTLLEGLGSRLSDLYVFARQFRASAQQPIGWGSRETNQLHEVSEKVLDMYRFIWERFGRDASMVGHKLPWKSWGLGEPGTWPNKGKPPRGVVATKE